MPVMAALTVTIVRTVFLKNPFHWRSKLSFKNQFVIMSLASIWSFSLGFLPMLRLCNLAQFEDQCVLKKNWTVQSVTCFILTLGLGLLVPKIAVVALYSVIYKVVDEARKLNRMISRTTINATSNHSHKINGHSDTPETPVSIHTGETPSKRSSMEPVTERETIPWSLIVILLLNLVSCAPWIALVGAPELLYRDTKSEYYLILDVAYSSLLIATAANPLAYLITTRVVRKKTVQCFRNCFNCLARQHC